MSRIGRLSFSMLHYLLQILRLFVLLILLGLLHYLDCVFSANLQIYIRRFFFVTLLLKSINFGLRNDLTHNSCSIWLLIVTFWFLDARDEFRDWFKAEGLVCKAELWFFQALLNIGQLRIHNALPDLILPWLYTFELVLMILGQLRHHSAHRGAIGIRFRSSQVLLLHIVYLMALNLI